MKNLIITSLAALFIFATALAGIKPPRAVQSAFTQKFPAATKVTWEKENDREFEAEFMVAGEKHSVIFSETGEWISTERPMKLKDLPEPVRTSCDKKYKGATILTAEKIENSKGLTIYELEIKRGSKKQDVIFTADGMELKSE